MSTFMANKGVTSSVSGMSWTLRTSPWARPLPPPLPCCAAKHKPGSPHADCGDCVIIINAERPF